MSAILSGKMRMEELPVLWNRIARGCRDSAATSGHRDIDVNVEFHDWPEGIIRGDGRACYRCSGTS